MVCIIEVFAKDKNVSLFDFSLQFVCAVYDTDWRHELIKGASTMWGCLAIGNVATVIIYIIYIFTKLDWTKAIVMSEKRIKKTIESTTATMNANDIDLNSLDVDKEEATEEDDML